MYQKISDVNMPPKMFCVFQGVMFHKYISNISFELSVSGIIQEICLRTCASVSGNMSFGKNSQQTKQNAKNEDNLLRISKFEFIENYMP